MLLRWVTLICVLFAALVSADAVWENTKYARTIDLSKAYVKESSVIEAQNLADTPQDTYLFYTNDGFDLLPELLYISVTLTDKKRELQPFKLSNNLYLIKLPFPIASGSSVEFKVTYVYTNSLLPFPEKIRLDDTQKLLLKLNKFPYSEYTTNEYELVFSGITKGQEMDLQLSEVKATENLPEMKGRVTDGVLAYGPVEGPVEPFAVVPMGLLYDHNRPISRVVNLERSFWLPGSDIDVLQTEEYYELTNNGAHLKDGFSRVDWMKGRYEILRKHHALSQLEFPINKKAPFDNYYVTDKVGMVSTHQEKMGHLLIVPRYPLMGGWNYNFTLGWSNKLENFVHKVKDQEDTYIARVPLLNTLQDIYYDNVNVNFYLPEGAEYVEFSGPLKPDSVEVLNEKLYLDVAAGHVKVTAHYKNLYDDFSKVDAYIVYRYTAKAYWSKVGKIAGFVMTALAAYYALNMVNVSVE